MLNNNLRIRYLIAGFICLFICSGKIFNQVFQEEPLLLKERNITLSEAINLALQNNPLAKNAELKVQVANFRKANILEFGATGVTYHYGQIHSSFTDQCLGITQSFGSPLAQIQKNKLNKQQLRVSEEEQQLIIRNLVMQVKTSWFRWLLSLQNFLIAEKESILYTQNLEIAKQRNEFTDTVSLEQSEMETRFAEIQNNQYQAAENFKLATNDMKALLFINDNIFPSDTLLEMYAMDVQTVGAEKFSSTNFVRLYNENVDLKTAQVSYEKAKFYPEIAAGYFNQEIGNVKGFQGVSLEILVPLWFFPQKSRIKESKIETSIARNELEYQKFLVQRRIESLQIKLDQLFVKISFYRENALKQAELLERETINQYKSGTITYKDFMNKIHEAFSITQAYYETIMEYNVAAVELEYYIK